jgi:hypothetical protein
VADDVAAVELDEGDAFDFAEDFAGLDESGLAVGGEVDLGEVAGDDRLGTEAEAGEEHEHLFGGGVLGFVEDDEGMVEGAAAHVGEGCDFDGAAFHAALDFVDGEHVMEGVVEGAEVRGDFFVEIAGEKAEGFAGLDRGAGEDDAGNLFGFEGNDRHGHGEVGFAGAGGADAEGEVVLADGLDVAFLADGFGVTGDFLGEVWMRSPKRSLRGVGAFVWITERA